MLQIRARLTAAIEFSTHPLALLKRFGDKGTLRAKAVVNALGQKSH